jgi:transposase-like protein
MDEDQARGVLEKLRWPDGVRCVKCESVDGVYKITSAKGSTTRPGVFACRDCKGQFSVTVGTIFEDSHIPLGKWLVAVHLMAASEKGVSAHQLHRMLGITYKSAWFVAHRIRHAMAQEPLAGLLLRGTVEADETFVGGIPKNRHVNRRVPAPPKMPVLSLVERNGNVRSVKLPNATGKTLRAAVKKHVDASAVLMTDGNASSKGIGKECAGLPREPRGTARASAYREMRLSAGLPI